jgi:hypothetical protein
MATLLRLKPTGAKRAHTCDARCYNAKGKDCHCFCNGANHGRGFEFAVDNIIKNMPTFQNMGCTLAKAIEDAVAMLKQIVQ